MTQPIDPRDLTALLAGRIQGRERDELLARIADSEESYDVFADTASILREMEEEDAAAAAAPQAAAAVPAPADPHGPDPRPPVDPDVIPIQSHRKFGGRTTWIAAGIAAVLAAAVLIPVLRRGGGDWGDPDALAQRLADAHLTVADAGTHPWSRWRGSEAQMEATARGARLGALQVDLSLAAATGDTAATDSLAGAIDVLLSPVPAAGPVRKEYRDIQTHAASPPAELRESVRQAAKDAAPFVDRAARAQGAWAEAARIAAARRDTAFFRSDESRRALDGLERSPLLDDAARAAVRSVRDAAGRNEAPDWKRLSGDLARVLETLAG